MPELTYLEAIRTAMHDEMEIDDRVFVMGEDVGRQGGAFGATKGIQQKYGELRSIDTPVAEAEHARVCLHLVVECGVDRLEIGELGHGYSALSAKTPRCASAASG